ncbi:hypothetical protein O6H91_Y315800 [Diphasiastrum complanatum]|nr:hypothetical protein O6H91_Y315800 [Diphasiastrum complanatum]
MGLASAFLSASHDHGRLGGGGGSIALGIFLALLSAVANGTFAVFSKTETVRRANVDPLVFNFWACVGIALSSLLVLVVEKFVWTLLGLLSGLLFVLSAANAYRAVRLIGISIGAGIWSATAVLVSFVAGLLLDPKATIHNLPLAIAGIIIILGGIGGITWVGQVGGVVSGVDEDLETLIYRQRRGRRMGSLFVNGILSALLTGVFGGLILIPMTQAPQKAQGLRFLPSFGIGVAIFAPIVTILPHLSISRYWPQFSPEVAAFPGIISGLVWNIGNIFSILAILYLGYPIAYPIIQPRCINSGDQGADF